MSVFSSIMMIASVASSVTVAAAASAKRPVRDLDANAVRRFLDGDQTAFAEIFDRYKASIIAFCARFTRRRDVAEELAQDVFIKAYQHLPGWRPEASLQPWLFRVARNHCLNRVRKRENQPGTVHIELSEPAAHGLAAATLSPEAHVDVNRLGRALDRALGDLPEAQRSAFILSKTEHLSYDEIAEVLGTSVSAVKSLLNRAKTTLIGQLGPQLRAVSAAGPGR